MSLATNFSLLTKVRPYKSKWRVQVKCLHSWKQNTSFGGDTFEMVLADQMGNKIHASCKKTHMFRVQRGLPVDEWRVIENMTISAAGGSYRTTKHPYKMTITDETVFSGSDLTDENLFLSFADYEEIGNDVIGKVHELGVVQTVQVFGQDMNKIELRLIDTNGNELACCLWGTYADQTTIQLEQNSTYTCIS
ncbi:hypothetical protein N665_0092s0034 [Sinapis alba]|nr:hypothetical protein N665_0092s0034 [Sinapis alba]